LHDDQRTTGVRLKFVKDGHDLKPIAAILTFPGNRHPVIQPRKLRELMFSAMKRRDHTVAVDSRSIHSHVGSP